MYWRLSSSSDPVALALVDGTGKWRKYGPHYSRRTPGSKTFTGVGREVVLVTLDEDAVWAAVLQKTPAKRGTGASRGRSGYVDNSVQWVWRNMLFRNLGPRLSSILISEALVETYRYWKEKYGSLPTVRLRTEVDIRKVKSSNPGYCYQCAGWEKEKIVRGKLYLLAPRKE